MRKIFIGVGVVIAAGSLYYFGPSHLGPTTAPTSTVAQVTTAPVTALAPPAAPSIPELPIAAPSVAPESVAPVIPKPVAVPKTKAPSPEVPKIGAAPDANPGALPYTTQKYLHDPFTEAPPARSRAAASTFAAPAAASDAASGVTSAATSDANDWTNCAPSDYSPAPDDAGKANIKRANEWAAAASGKAAPLGLGAGRYDWLRCRGDVIAEWLAAGGPEPPGWLGRRGFDSPLAMCAYQIVVNRPAAAAQYQVLATLNGSEYPATLASCDSTNADVCAYTFTARCELQRQLVTAKWVGPSTIECLHGDTKTATDGACVAGVQP